MGNIAGTLGKKGYRRIAIYKKRFLEHRLAWLYVNGEFPPEQIDHINHIRDDNRIENLRAVSNQENQRNSSKRNNNTSGITGVSWHKRDINWKVRINLDGKIKYLGIFEDYFEAICVRKSAELYFGYHENHGN